jgi:4a-hydroxytetrahydrobiopterin dehydratase
VSALCGTVTAEVDMSERGWRNFLAAQGVSDWVVLHGGATAVFRVRSVVEAARLAEAIAHVLGSTAQAR